MDAGVAFGGGELANGEILIYAKATSSPWLASEVGRELPQPKDDLEASGRARPRAGDPGASKPGGCSSSFLASSPPKAGESATGDGGLFEFLIDQRC